MIHSFAGTPDRPFHLSVGAVVLDQDNLVLAHKYDTNEVPLNEARDANGDINVDFFYTIMTETPEEGEGFLDALKRGCMEEFGAEVELIGFIGTHVGHFSRPKTPDISIEKNIPFFLCRTISVDDSKRPEGAFESQSEIIRITPEELAGLLDQQFQKIGRTDSDLGDIVRRASTLI